MPKKRSKKCKKGRVGYSGLFVAGKDAVNVLCLSARVFWSVCGWKGFCECSMFIC